MSLKGFHFDPRPPSVNFLSYEYDQLGKGAVDDSDHGPSILVLTQVLLTTMFLSIGLLHSEIATLLSNVRSYPPAHSDEAFLEQLAHQRPLLP